MYKKLKLSYNLYLIPGRQLFPSLRLNYIKTVAFFLKEKLKSIEKHNDLEKQMNYLNEKMR